MSSSRSRAETVGEAHTTGTAHTDSIATTEGTARSKSHTVGKGQSEGRSWAKTNERGLSVGVGHTTGASTGTSETWSHGFTEGLMPILEDRPGAVHGRDNVVHMAAELINNLPTGVAIVKALGPGNTIESAIVQVPLVRDAPEKIEGTAKAQLLANTPGALPAAEADRIIVERRERLKAEGARLLAPPPEPKSYRQPLKAKGAGSRERTTNRSRP